jgi:mono/diheme cytochrome c family protein
MRTLSVVAAAILALGTALVGVFSGMVDVAASSSHPELVRRLLRTTMERSVVRRASDIVPPETLSDPRRIERGFAAYEDMCVVCHAAPGATPSVIARGLDPEPPSLSEAARRWSDAELFWIVEHGIRMTGMPSFGATHETHELWDVVAFLRQLQTLSEQQYDALRAARATAPREGGAAVERSHDHRR